MKKPFIIAVLFALVLLFTASAFATQNGNLINFDVSPNPMDKFCTISLSLQSQMFVTLQIQTQEGDIVKDIFSGEANKDMSFQWNRLDNCDMFVPAGKYMAVLSYNGRYTSTKKTLILK